MKTFTNLKIKKYDRLYNHQTQISNIPSVIFKGVTTKEEQTFDIKQKLSLTFFLTQIKFNLFGGPGTSFKLFIKLNQENNLLLHPGSSSTTACEGKKLSLVCGPGQEIDVVSANYGRQNNYICVKGIASQ